MDRIPSPGELYRHFKDRIYQIIAIATHSETGEMMVVYQAMYGDFGVYVRPLSMFVSEVDHQKYPHITQRYRFEKMERTLAGSPGVTAGSLFKRESGDRMPDGPAGGETEQTVKADTALQQETDQIPAVRRPRTQRPAVSKRALQPDTEEETDQNSDYFQKRRRQIAEREQRREQFRRPARHESATDELRANPNLLKFLDADTYEKKYQVLNEIQDDMTNRLIDDIAVVLDVVIPEGSLSDRYYQLKNIILTRQKYEKNRLR